MKKLIFLILTLICVPLAGQARKNPNIDFLNQENRELLLRLDSVLKRAPQYDADKEVSINKLKSALRCATDPEHRYWLATNLYDEYAPFNSDSAMVYVNLTGSLARALGRQGMIVDSELNKAYVLSATGLLDEASKCISAIEGLPMTEQQRCNFVDRALFLNTHRRQYMGTPADKNTLPYSQRVDSLLKDAIGRITPDNPNYSWIVGWGNMKSRKDALRAIEIVKPKVDRSQFQTRRDAMDAWVLSRLYEYAGDRESKMKYLILSAISDVRAGVKEMASLQEIAELLLNAGEVERSNEYINYCFNSAVRYKSRVRMESLASLKDRCMTQLMEINKRKSDQVWTLAWCLSAIAVVLLVALFYIRRQVHLLRKSRREVGEANEMLERKVAELEHTRGELHESNRRLEDLYVAEKNIARELASVNSVKERYIANVFTLCSNYITKFDDFRKNIGALAKEKRYEELRELTRNPELSYGEIKELYANFDRIFLELYPNFVADFNKLLRPEERIELRNPGVLNTELRIYALVRLGLTDSVKIARFLHISVQTVYNTRQRIRNKADGPRQGFADRVAQL